MAVKDGGPAFSRDGGADTYAQVGMSLRDWFAGQALTGVFASGSHRDVAAAIDAEQERADMSLTPAQVGHIAEQRIAAMVYAMADAMLAARAEGASHGE